MADRGWACLLRHAKALLISANRKAERFDARRAIGASRSRVFRSWSGDAAAAPSRSGHKRLTFEAGGSRIAIGASQLANQVDAGLRGGLGMGRDDQNEAGGDDMNEAHCRVPRFRMSVPPMARSGRACLLRHAKALLISVNRACRGMAGAIVWGPPRPPSCGKFAEGASKTQCASSKRHRAQTVQNAIAGAHVDRSRQQLKRRLARRGDYAPR
jgi:hypothetical protein